MEKVSFTKKSKKVCKDCGTKLKQNSANKGHKHCYGCHSLRTAQPQGSEASKSRINASLKKMRKNPGIFNFLFNIK